MGKQTYKKMLPMKSKDLFLSSFARLLGKSYFGTSVNTTAIQANLELLSIGEGIREGLNHLFFLVGSKAYSFYLYSVSSEASSRCNLSVPPCCVDYDGLLPFGSMLDEPDLNRRFNSKLIRRIRLALRKPQTMPALCSHCHYRVASKQKDAA